MRVTDVVSFIWDNYAPSAWRLIPEGCKYEDSCVCIAKIDRDGKYYDAKILILSNYCQNEKTCGSLEDAKNFVKEMLKNTKKRS